MYGVNPGGAESHRKFRAKHGLPYALLVDEGKRVARLYNAHGPMVKRTVYVIGKDGQIKFGKRGMPKFADVLNCAD